MAIRGHPRWPELRNWNGICLARTLQTWRFHRFYYGYFVGDRRVIRGEVLGLSNLADQKIYITPEFPIVKDGGCAVITLEYDLQKRKLMSLHRNPDA